MLSGFAQPRARRAWGRRLLTLAPDDDAAFDALARELFAWQFAQVPACRRLGEAHGVTPDHWPGWRRLPAVPQQLFKRKRLFAHGTARPGAVFETSGTTTGQPGRQYLLRPDLYRTVSVEGARRPGLGFAGPFHVLAPPPGEAPHSSLSAMFGFWARDLAPARATFWLRGGRIDFPTLRRTLARAIATGHPLALAGTAFSFVHLLDAWAALPPLQLPRGSWVLETGGFKGRSREVPKADLYRALARALGVPDRAIWNEYGMSELSSQAYARGTGGRHAVPPWARVLVVDPATGREVPAGRRGLVRWIDLANVDSVLALQTLDLAERTPEGFHLLGRLPRTEPRGCSLSVEDLALAAARP